MNNKLNAFLLALIIVLGIGISLFAIELDEVKNQFEDYKEIYVLKEPREFNTVNELRVWLILDDTSENEYKEKYYDCEDFAFELTDNARRDGFLIYSMGNCWYFTEWIRQLDAMYYNIPIWHWREIISELRCHAYCVTRIDTLWYMIEPSTDEITLLGMEI